MPDLRTQCKLEKKYAKMVMKPTWKRGLSYSHRPYFRYPSDRYIICVGAVAYGRDSVGQLRYAIYDSEWETLEHRSVKGRPIPTRLGVKIRLNVNTPSLGQTRG